LSEDERIRAWQPPELQQSGGPAAQALPAHPPNQDVDSLLEQKRQEAYAEGYARGEVEGRRDGEQRATQLVADMAQLWSAMATPFRLQSELLIDELKELITAMVREIVRVESLSHPGLVVAVLEELVTDLRQASGAVEVYLHPDDRSTVERFLADIEPLATTVVLLEDTQMLSGGCRIAAPEWFIDASLERRIADCISQLSAPHSASTQGQD